jgi:hypothetical protein
MKCCGFEYITDSQPETDCAGEYTISCKQATLDKIDEYLVPLASAGVAIAVIEVYSNFFFGFAFICYVHLADLYFLYDIL